MGNKDSKKPENATERKIIQFVERNTAPDFKAEKYFQDVIDAQVPITTSGRCRRFHVVYKGHIDKKSLREFYMSKQKKFTRVDIAHEPLDKIHPYSHTHVVVSRHGDLPDFHYTASSFNFTDQVPHVRKIADDAEYCNTLVYIARKDPENKYLITEFVTLQCSEEKKEVKLKQEEPRGDVTVKHDEKNIAKTEDKEIKMELKAHAKEQDEIKIYTERRENIKKKEVKFIIGRRTPVKPAEEAKELKIKPRLCIVRRRTNNGGAKNLHYDTDSDIKDTSIIKDLTYNIDTCDNPERLISKFFHIVYKGHLDKNTIKEFFTGEPLRFDKVTVAHESADIIHPYLHTHVIIARFRYNVVYDSRKTDAFDIVDNHPFIKSLNNNEYYNALLYITREDVDANSEISREIRSENSERKVYGEEEKKLNIVINDAKNDELKETRLRARRVAASRKRGLRSSQESGKLTEFQLLANVVDANDNEEKIHSKYFHLVYREHLDKKEIINFFTERPLQFDQISIAHESSDKIHPYKHTHVVIARMQYDVLFNSRNANIFDIGDSHPFFKQLNSSEYYLALFYIAKEDIDAKNEINRRLLGGNII